MLRIDVLEGRPVQGENGILGRQSIADYNRQSVQRVLGDAAGKELTVAVLHQTSQLALHRFLVESNQNRLIANLFERGNVLLLLECQLQQSQSILVVVASEGKTSQHVPKHIVLQLSRSFVVTEA